MFNFIAAWRRQRQTIRELAILSDRELADIGIGRETIGAVVRKTLRPGAELETATLAPSWAAQNRRAISA